MTPRSINGVDTDWQYTMGQAKTTDYTYYFKHLLYLLFVQHIPIYLTKSNSAWLLWVAIIKVASICTSCICTVKIELRLPSASSVSSKQTRHTLHKMEKEVFQTSSVPTCCEEVLRTVISITYTQTWLRRVFDTVNHQILPSKLSLFNFSPAAIQWFKSYLHGR